MEDHLFEDLPPRERRALSSIWTLTTGGIGLHHERGGTFSSVSDAIELGNMILFSLYKEWWLQACHVVEEAP